jgi:predicted transporter
MLLSTLLMIGVGWYFSRRWSRGQKTDAAAFTGV